MDHSTMMAVFTGSANPALAQDIARHLMQPLGRAIVGHFSDGETQVELMENVRGRDVFLVQSTSPSANDHLMELLVMADACRRASAWRITAVIPYFGYARQDRRPRAARGPSRLISGWVSPDRAHPITASAAQTDNRRCRRRPVMRRAPSARRGRSAARRACGFA